jgi:hypothetical protein
MGSDFEQNIKSEQGKMIISFPSYRTILSAIALYVADFPSIRNMILFFTILVLVYHPANNLTRFLGMTTIGLVGFILLKDWAQKFMTEYTVDINANFAVGCSLLGMAIGFAVFQKTALCQTPS